MARSSKATRAGIRAAEAVARMDIAEARQRGWQTPLMALLILYACRDILRRRRHRRHHRTASLGLSFTAIEKGSSPMADPITITPTQDVLCKLAPLDTNGNPTAPAVEWVSSNEAVIRLEVATDTLSARGVSVGPGSSTITAHTGSIASGTPVIAESGLVTVGDAPPPPPPAQVASLGLTLEAVDK